MKKLVLVFGLLAIASMAHATSVSIGMTENGVGSFNIIDIFLIIPGPGTFTTPGMTTLSNASWSDTNKNSVWTEATGPSTTSLSFNLIFSYTGTPVYVELFSHLDGVQKDGAEFKWDGQNFTFLTGLNSTDFTNDVTQSSAVPEPSTLVLWSIGLGLMGLGMVHKKRLVT
jgi:hypothetical protein